MKPLPGKQDDTTYVLHAPVRNHRRTPGVHNASHWHDVVVPSCRSALSSRVIRRRSCDRTIAVEKVVRVPVTCGSQPGLCNGWIGLL